MADLKTISYDLTQNLGLKYLPAGVILYRNHEQPPVDIPFTETKLKSFCQALALAGQGKTMLLKKEQLGCTLGTSVLGFEEEAEDYLDSGAFEKYEVGLFASEEASAESILKSTYLPKGQTKAALIAPITSFQELPQVVIFSANSEQVMWLLYAVNYEKGGAINLPQTGGALGGCSDVTAWPLLEGKPNVTFLGLGCRLKSALDACHLMMGIPGNMLEMVHTHILNLAKPITMLKEAQSKM
ncbi:MAG: DUF169 domain-containing protein [Nitrospirota bacterium]|nr:DUF169 domain-containing protein [Nitrospirota bacterium]